MSELVNWNIQDVAELASASTTQLKEELAKAVTITAETLQYMGRIWQELERRGEDMSELRSGLAAYLPAIASGRLRAEAVVRFAGKAMLLNKLAALPINQQDELLAAGEIEVIAPNSDGGVETQKVPLHRVSSEHLRVAFGPHGLRNLKQQRMFALPVVRPRKAKRTVDTTLNFDERGFLRSGRMAVTARGERIGVREIARAVADHLGVEIEIPSGEDYAETD